MATLQTANVESTEEWISTRPPGRKRLPGRERRMTPSGYERTLRGYFRVCHVLCELAAVVFVPLRIEYSWPPEICPWSWAR